MITLSRLLIVTFVTAGFTSLQADDWPRWLGPQQDSVWRESEIIETFPEDGPETLWRTPVGYGYSSPTVVGDRVYLSDYEITEGEVFNNPSSRGPLQGNERVHALDLATGEVLWTHAYERPYNLSYPGGPRCTPAYDEGHIYHLGAEGDLICLDAMTGDVIWKLNFQEAYQVESPIWGFAAHPLVAGDLIYCMVGGEGSAVVAFDKNTGEEKWSGLTAVEPGYCPPSIIRQAGVDQLIIWHSDSINALDPLNGAVYWSLPLKPNYGMAIMTPQKYGDILFACGIGRVAAAISLGTETPTAEFLWKANPRNAVFSANSTPLIKEGIVYGCNVQDSKLIAVELETGNRLWETTQPTLGTTENPHGARHGTAFMTFHEESGKFYLFAENGDLIIADLTPEGYTEHARANILEPTNEAFGRPVVWAAPAFANRSALVRNDRELVRVNLAK